MNEDNRQRTLAEIRRAIAENDGLRLDAAVSAEERKALEEAAFTLRNLERELLEDTSDALLERLESASGQLKDMSKTIRAKVTEMNEPSKVIEHFKNMVSLVVRVLTEVARW